MGECPSSVKHFLIGYVVSTSVYKGELLGSLPTSSRVVDLRNWNTLAKFHPNSLFDFANIFLTSKIVSQVSMGVWRVKNY